MRTDKVDSSVRSRRSTIKTMAAIGSGAFLLGAVVPIASALTTKGVGAVPAPITPVLLTFLTSPGVDAFPTVVSSEKLCRLPLNLVRDPASPSDADTLGLFQGGALQQASIALGQSGLHQLAAEPWPNIHPQARLARVPVLMYHDVLPEPEVFFDLLPEQFEQHLQRLLEQGLTPISPDQLVQHLRTGAPLPEKPILITLDDGYVGHYEQVYPLLQKYQVPATFFVFPGKVDGEIVGRSTLTWEQLKTMAADPLVTIASHSVTHPPDLRTLSDEALTMEVVESKRRLEEELGIPIRYFSYPAGHYDERVAQAVADAGYLAAFTMRQSDEQFAGASESLLAIERFGQSNLEALLGQAWGGEGDASAISMATAPSLPAPNRQLSANFDFSSPVELERRQVDRHSFSLITGGRPVTIHADSRYQVPEILAGTNIKGAVDGGFFSLEYLDSNVMIGPVLSQSTKRFVPGNPGENPRLNSRPLVLIAPDRVSFIPFDANQHNTLAGLYQALPGVTDAFVAAAWLVRDGEPQPPSSFGTLFDFDARRHRAFWGINQAGQPVVGVTHTMVDSVELGQLLHQAGLQDAVMLDSGASTSLAYEGQSLVGYIPRPVPHVVGLIPPEANDGSPCPLRMPE